MYVSKPSPARDQDARRILVIDHHAVDRGLIAVSLRLSGYDVWSTSTGEQAIDVARSMKPDLILIESDTPRGRILARRFRGDPELSSVRLLRVLDAAHVRHDPGPRTVVRPIDHRVLLETIETTLSKPPPRPSYQPGTIEEISARLRGWQAIEAHNDFVWRMTPAGEDHLIVTVVQPPPETEDISPFLAFSAMVESLVTEYGIPEALEQLHLLQSKQWAPLWAPIGVAVLGPDVAVVCNAGLVDMRIVTRGGTDAESTPNHAAVGLEPSPQYAASQYPIEFSDQVEFVGDGGQRLTFEREIQKNLRRSFVPSLMFVAEAVNWVRSHIAPRYRTPLVDHGLAEAFTTAVAQQNDGDRGDIVLMVTVDRGVTRVVIEWSGDAYPRERRMRASEAPDPFQKQATGLYAIYQCSERVQWRRDGRALMLVLGD